MTFVGRAQAVRDLVNCQSKVVLLTGDSGVGKSVVLRAAQIQSHSALAPDPIRLRSAPGALQRGLLESLATALVEVSENESTTERIGRVIVDTVGRVAEAGFKDLAAGVGHQLLGVVSNRLSPELATLLSAFAGQLVNSTNSDLLARINNTGDSDVVDIVCGFAAEVQKLSEGRILVLALDEGDRLDESDRRRLADLASVLPNEIIVRVAFSTWNSQTLDQADELVQRGVKSFELTGLDEPAIRDWLLESGLPATWAAQVRRTTNGYALHVAAAIDLLLETNSIASLDGLGRSEIIGASTRRLWRDLDIPLRVVVQRLSSFSSWMNVADASTFLGVESDVWLALRKSLTDARIFTGEPPWFHELRRRFIWSDILDEVDRFEARRRAIEYFEQRLALPKASPEEYVQYANLISMGRDDYEPDTPIAKVLEAGRDEVAVVGALIELANPSFPASSADNVILYAHQVFGAEGDLALALQQLVEYGFVHIASSAQELTVTPTWSSVDVFNLFSGRAAAELGRLPTPLLATAVFESVLRDQLGEFRSGVYGIGAPRIGELSRMAAQQQRIQADGALHFGKMGPNLLLRFTNDGLPLYAAFAYDDAEVRDAASERLTEWESLHDGQKLTVVDCLPDPQDCVPSLRFFVAMERLTGTSLLNAVNGPSPHPRKLDVPISIDEEMRLRAATLETARRLCSNQERLACSLEAPTGYLYLGTAELSEAIHLVGRPGATRLKEHVPALFGSLLYRVEISRQANLVSGERLGLMTQHQGSQQTDPVLHELTWLFQQTAKYNEYQRRIVVNLEASNLETLIANSSTRMASDALELMSSLHLKVDDDDLQRRAVMGSSTYALVHLDSPDSQWVPGAKASIVWAIIPNHSGEHTATVHLNAQRESNGAPNTSYLDVKRSFANRFDFDPTDVDRMTYGMAIDSLAVLMGHRTSELRFQYS